jgi:hypothetical protein
MRLAALVPALAVVAGCGGAGSGVPDGYVTYRGDGVSFAHPEGWRATTRSLGHDVTQVRLEDPAVAGPAISLTVQPGVGERFDAQLEGELSVLEEAGGADVDRRPVEVPGAEKAVRSTIGSPGARGEAVDVLTRDGSHVALAAGGPEGQRAVDAAAVVESLRVEE